MADPKQMAQLAKKAAGNKGPPPPPKKGGGGKGGPPPQEHHEPDGDELDDGSEPDDHDEGSESDQPQGDFGGHSDKEIADALADLIEKGIVSPSVKRAAEGLGDDDGTKAKPEWVGEDEECWNRAVNAVQPNGTGKDEYADPWLVTVATYQLFGGDVPSDKGGDSGSEDEGGEFDEDEGGEFDGGDLGDEG